MAPYVVRTCSYFPVHSEHSVHSERYALCGRAFKVSLLLYIHDIPSVYSSGIQLCVGYWIYIIQIKFHIHKLYNVQHTHQITAQSFFLTIKPTRCTNFTNLFWHETLHFSDSSYVHHQEFIHCTPTNGICHTGL